MESPSRKIVVVPLEGTPGRLWGATHDSGPVTPVNVEVIVQVCVTIVELGGPAGAGVGVLGAAAEASAGALATGVGEIRIDLGKFGVSHPRRKTTGSNATVSNHVLIAVLQK
jgi:hypothetical protein